MVDECSVTEAKTSDHLRAASTANIAFAVREARLRQRAGADPAEEVEATTPRIESCAGDGDVDGEA